MAKPPGPGRCVHCLKSRQTRTWDHVLPKGWYPDSTPENIKKWQIPSCIKCNREYGKLEDELLVRIGLCLDPEDLKAAGVSEKAIRAINPRFGKSSKDTRRRQAKREKILRESMLGPDIPDHGIYPGFDEAWGRPRDQQLAIPFRAEHIRRLTEKIVRGIFFIEDNMLIEPPFNIEFYALSESGAEPIKNLLDRFGKEYVREPGIVVRRAVAPEDATSSVFEIAIWGRLKMFAAVNRPDA